MTTHTHRLFLDKSNPEVYKALNGVSLAVNRAAEKAGVPRSTLEIMYVWISQINRCVTCLELHSRLAIKAGVPAGVVAQIPVWREAKAFTDEERAALAVGEMTTTLPDPDYRKQVLAQARTTLGDEAFAVIEWAAITLNAYNRVSILSEHPALKIER